MAQKACCFPFCCTNFKYSVCNNF